MLRIAPVLMTWTPARRPGGQWCARDEAVLKVELLKWRRYDCILDGTLTTSRPVLRPDDIGTTEGGYSLRSTSRVDVNNPGQPCSGLSRLGRPCYGRLRPDEAKTGWLRPDELKIVPINAKCTHDRGQRPDLPVVDRDKDMT